MIRIGEVLDGRFQIKSVAGHGGMSTIYRAIDHQTGDPVAVKVLLDQDQKTIRRFLKEAKVLSSLSHPGIVQYLSHGQVSSGTHFLIMEWLEGEDLAKYLSQKTLSVSQSILLISRVAEALAVAHSQKIFHRDIKPHNLFLPYQDPTQVKILDFGVAHIAKTEQEVSDSQRFVGTPAYVSPEQAEGLASLDARTDLFSLGCTFFACLCGKPPFIAPNFTGVLVKILFEEAPRIRSLCPKVPKRLDDLIAKLLQKSPQARPQSANELRQELASIHSTETGSEHADTSYSLTRKEQRFFCVVLAPDILPSLERENTFSTIEAGGLTPLSMVDQQTDTSPPPASFEEFLSIADDAKTIPNLKIPGQVELFQLQEEAVAYGGKLSRLIDGAVVVTFLQGAATDQAFQAARYALSLSRKYPGAPIALSIGKGQTLGDDTYSSPVGEVIDRAAQLLEQFRNRRGIWVDKGSANLLQSRFEVIKNEREEGLYIEKERHSFLGGVRTLMGKPTPCFGREQEFHTLKTLLKTSIKKPLAQAVLISARAGVGKSRLRHEFLQWIEDREETITLLVSQGDPTQNGTPFGFITQALRQSARIFEGEPVSLRQQKLRNRLSRCLEGNSLEQANWFLGELLGIWQQDQGSAPLLAARQNPSLMMEHLRATFVDWLKAECQARPVLFVLEDLHWSDSPSVQLLAHAVKTLQNQALFVLALARPEVQQIFPELWEGSNITVLSLQELQNESSKALVRHVLGRNVHPALVERLVHLSGGNAFYLEELCRATVEDNQKGKLPENVVAMAQARLGRLSEQQRLFLRAGSIFGEVFWVEGAYALLGKDWKQKDKLSHDLPKTLVKNELLKPSLPAKFPAQEQLAFRHSFLREAAYVSLTEQDKILGHQLAADWLIQAGERDTSILGVHWELAKEDQKAQKFYVQGARAAVKTYSHKEAEKLYLSYLRLVKTPEQESISIRNEFGEKVLEVQGKMEEAQQQHTLALEEAKRANLISLEGQSLYCLGIIKWRTGHVEEAETLLYKKALPILRQVKDQKTEGLCIGNLGNLYQEQGRWKEALSFFEQAISLFRKINDKSLEAKFLSSLGILYSAQGKLEKAKTFHEKSLTLSRQSNNLNAEGLSLGNLGAVTVGQGKQLEAVKLYKEALAILQQVGNRLGEGIVLGNLANVHYGERRLQEAETLYKRAILVTRTINSRRFEGIFLGYLANTYRDQGKPEKAKTYYSRALAMIRLVEDKRLEGFFQGALSIFERWYKNDLKTAWVLAKKGETLLEEVGDTLELAQLLCAQGHLFLAEGKSAKNTWERIQTLLKNSQKTPKRKLQKKMDTLSRAQKLFEAKQQDKLFRGEFFQDIPEGVRQYLITSGVLSPKESTLLETNNVSELF